MCKTWRFFPLESGQEAGSLKIIKRYPAFHNRTSSRETLQMKLNISVFYSGVGGEHFSFKGRALVLERKL